MILAESNRELSLDHGLVLRYTHPGTEMAFEVKGSPKHLQSGFPPFYPLSGIWKLKQFSCGN